MKRKYISAAVAVAFLLIITFVAMSKSIADYRQHNWAQTTGTINKVTLTKAICKTHGINMTENRYCPELMYTYNVKGISYESGIYDDDDVMLTFSDKEEGEKFLEKFSVGSEVTVYYKHYNPSISALKISKTVTPVGSAISAVIFAMTIYIAMCTAAEAKKERNKQN